MGGDIASNGALPGLRQLPPGPKGYWGLTPTLPPNADPDQAPPNQAWGAVWLRVFVSSSSISAFRDSFPISVLGKGVSRNSTSFGISIGDSLSLRNSRSS